MAATWAAIESRALLGEAFRVFGAQRGHVLEGDAVGRYVSGSWAEVWSVTMSIGALRREQLGKHVGGVAEQADGQRPPGVAGGDGAADGVVDVVGLLVQVAVLDPAGDPGLVALDADGHAAVHGHGQRLGAAHAAQAGGQRDRAGQGAAEALGRDRRRRSRRCPAGCPGCRCRSRSRRSSGRTWSGRACSRRRNSSQVAHCGTRLEFAMSTRGAHSWVRMTPTGLPDWTSMVSSCSRSCRVVMIAA